MGAGSWPFGETTALIRTITGARSRGEVLGALCRRIRRGVTDGDVRHPVLHVHVGVADPARRDVQHDLSRSGGRLAQLLHAEVGARGPDHDGPHRASPAISIVMARCCADSGERALETIPVTTPAAVRSLR